MRPPSAEPYTHDRDCACMGCCRKASAEAMQFLEDAHAKPASLADQIMAVEYAVGMPHGLYWAAKSLRWLEQNADEVKRLMRQAKQDRSAA